MFRNRYFSLTLTVLLLAVAFFGSSKVLAQGQTPPKSGSDQSGGEPPFLKHGKITTADRQAAADRRAEGGASSSAVTYVNDAYGNPVPDYFGSAPNYANSPLPTYSTGGVVTGGIQKFVNALPTIPVASPDVVTYPGADYYEIALQQYSQVLAAGLPATTLRGYVQTNNGTDMSGGCTAPVPGSPSGTDCTIANNTKPIAPIQYLGPIIVAQRDRPVRIKFTNQLQPGTNGDLFLPVDTSYMGAGYGPSAPTSVGLDDCSVPTGRPDYCYSQNRATLHLHGGTTPWISDGTPHQWTTPAGETTATGGSLYPEGVSVQNVPDMDGGTEPVGTLTFYYTNQESARLMFYHDHSYGLTRLNVYAGEAAGYLETDNVEQDLIKGTNTSGVFGASTPTSVLPAVGTPLIIQDKTFVPGAAQLAAEDPTWNSSRWGGLGNLWYPHVYMTNQNPWDITGANPMGRWDYGPWFWPPFTGLTNGEITNPYYDSTCNSAVTYCEPPFIPGTPVISGVPEGFMDTPLVNGMAYPTLSVSPTLTRFRILNAANDRYWNLQLYVTTGIVGSIDVTAAGAGYTTPPSVTFTNAAGDTTGHGATGIANINSSGAVTSIFLKTVGSGYTAAPTVTLGVPPLGGTQATATANYYAASTEVGMVPFNSTQNSVTPFPTGWYTSGNPFSLDDRDGGVPDPTTRGPAMVQIGTEGGWLPNPVKIGNTPINYDYNRRSITVLNVLQHGLFLGPAERADVLVDFSNFAGKTLILYSDSPAPVPAGDPRNDYYTGSPDQTSIGGAPTTYPGYGPNTRTIMQITVTGSGGTAPVDDFSASELALLKTYIPAAFATDEDTVIVPQAPYNSVYNPTLTCPGTAGCFPGDITAYVRIQDTFKTFDPIGPTGSITMNFQPKAIQELFTTDFGRMNATLGVELPNTNATIQTTIPYGYIDPITELVSVTDKAVQIGATGDGTQIWKITHNGVDTHVIHTHMFTMQLINRVGWDGAVKPPDANELGWKDTLRMNPLEDVIVAIRPISLVNLPFKVPNSIRPMDVTRPLGSTMGFFGVGPDGNPAAITNELINFGWEYVWHCHILGHEENDMMRPMAFGVAPETPSVLAAATATGPYRVNLTWNDNSLSATSFLVQRALDSGFTSGLVSFTVPKVAGVSQSYTDTSAVALTPYYYQVLAVDTVGATVASGFTAPAAPSYSMLAVNSLPSNVVQLATIPAAPSNLTATLLPGYIIRLNWTDNSTNETGFLIYRSINGGAFTSYASVGANVTTFTNGGLTPGNTYAYEVRAFNASGNSAYSNATTGILVPAIPAAPSGLTATLIASTSIRLNWTDNSTNETGFQIYRSVNGGAFTLLFTTAANAITYTNTGLAINTTYSYEVRAVNLAGNSAFAGPIAVTTPTLPAAPSNLVATLLPGYVIQLTWTDNSTNENAFLIYRSVNGGAYLSYATVGANVTTFANGGLTPGSTYSYEVRSTNVSGNSAFSNTSPGILVPAIPVAPSSLTATKLNATMIQLNWVDNSTNETGFLIYRSINGGAYASYASVGANVTTFANTGLTAGNTYSYEVRAYNASGNSAFSNTTPAIAM